MIYPDYKELVSKKGNIDSFLKNNYNDFLIYINSKFTDIQNIREKLYLFYFNLNEPPKCIVCGEKCIFFSLKKGYSEYCSQNCSNKSKKRTDKIKQTCLDKYGVENAAKSLSVKEKSKQTCIERYGVEFIGQYEQQKEKSKQTKQLKYGNENYNNTSKIKSTKQVRYNNEYWCNCDKIKQTKLEKYNNENFVNIDKMKQTCLERYGVDSYTKTEKFKDKARKSCLEKYGVDSYTKTEKFKDNISFNKDIIQQKIYNTKKQNNTFNTSSIETQFEQYLKENNINYKKQYKSKLYPFNCDFYLPDNNLYIEINAHWTHGGHPFNSTSKEDQLKLKSWKQKGTEFYDNAIETWTKRDVLKRETAKKNNLNYIEVFTNSLENLIKII
jgi:hypothetical protein